MKEIKCPFCGKLTYNNDWYCDTFVKEKDKLYHKEEFECHCGKRFYNKALICDLTDNDLKCAHENNGILMREVQYEVGCRATGYHESTIEVSVSSTYDEIHRLICEKEDVCHVDIYNL